MLWSTLHVCVARAGWIRELDSLVYPLAVVVLLRIFRHTTGERLLRRNLMRCINVHFTCVKCMYFALWAEQFATSAVYTLCRYVDLFQLVRCGTAQELTHRT